jgi:hypothetical protein
MKQMKIHVLNLKKFMVYLGMKIDLNSFLVIFFQNPENQVQPNFNPEKAPKFKRFSKWV